MNGAGGFTAPSSGQIAPGSITYTTSTGPDGQVTYHPFKAVPASYQTPQGVVHGIQWVPAEATQILPAGAQPATADFAASWNRGQLSRGEAKELEKWQRAEEKRRRKEEKQSMKRISQQFDNPAGYALPGTAAYGTYTNDLDRRFGELEVERKDGYGTRSRKNSYSGANRAPMYAPAAPGAGVYSSTTATYTSATGYPTTGNGSPYNRATSPFRPAGNFAAPPNNYPPAAGGSPYNRAASPFRPTGNVSTVPNNYPPAAGAGPYNRAASPFRPAGNFSTSPNARPQEFPSTYPGGPEPIARAPSPYAPQGHSPYGVRAPSPMPQPQPPPPRAPSPYARPPSRAPSPYHGQQPTAPFPARAPSPFVPPPQIHSTVYPRGHVLEGQPINAPRSRAPSPMPGGQGYVRAPSPMPGGQGFGRAPSPMPGAHAGSAFPSSPRMPSTAVGGEPLQLAAPEAFSRPPNAAQPYTPFNVMRIQDMDDFYDQIPRMPLVLDTHDVYHQDWIRFMNDLALSWAGKMPIPEFSRGGVPPKRSTLIADLINLWNDSFFRARRVEVVLYKGRERRSGPHAGTVDTHLPMPVFDSDSDLSDSDSSSSESDDGGYYGRGMDLAESKRRRREMKEEKKRRKREKKLKKKVKEREKQYSLYLTYVPPREMPSAGGHNNFYG